MAKIKNWSKKDATGSMVTHPSEEEVARWEHDETDDNLVVLRSPSTRFQSGYYEIVYFGPAGSESIDSTNTKKSAMNRARLWMKKNPELRNTYVDFSI